MTTGTPSGPGYGRFLPVELSGASASDLFQEIIAARRLILLQQARNWGNSNAQKAREVRAELKKVTHQWMAAKRKADH